MTQGRKVASTMKALILTRNLSVDFARGLNEDMLVPILVYEWKTLVWHGSKM